MSNAEYSSFSLIMLIHAHRKVYPYVQYTDANRQGAGRSIPNRRYSSRANRLRIALLLCTRSHPILGSLPEGRRFLVGIDTSTRILHTCRSYLTSNLPTRYIKNQIKADNN